jgi:hypothetical protein
MQCERWIFVLGLFVAAVFGSRRSLILHGVHGVFLFGVLCVENGGGYS